MRKKLWFWDDPNFRNLKIFFTFFLFSHYFNFIERNKENIYFLVPGVWCQKLLGSFFYADLEKGGVGPLGCIFLEL